MDAGTGRVPVHSDLAHVGGAAAYVHAAGGLAETVTGVKTFTSVLKFADGTFGAPGLAFAGAPTIGFYRSGAGEMAVAAPSSFSLHDGTTGLYARLSNEAVTGGALKLGAPGTLDALLYREGANYFLQRNATASQTFGVAKTYTDAGNYEIGRVGWSGTDFQVGTTHAGTGAARHLVLITAGSARWRVDSAAGHFDAATGAERIRWGTTAAFPMLVRSGTELQAQLADGSAFAPVTTGSLYVEGYGTGFLTANAVFQALSDIGPHCIGTAADATVFFRINNPTYLGSGLRMVMSVEGLLRPVAGDDAYGLFVAPTIREATSGIHGLFAGVFFSTPTITLGAATVTTSAVAVFGPTPVNGTKNYSIWSQGVVRVDGTLGTSVDRVPTVYATTIDATTITGALTLTEVILNGVRWGRQTTGTSGAEPGGSNTHVGYFAGGSVVGASFSTFIGYKAGELMDNGVSNTIIGYNAGAVLVGLSSERNTMVGTAAGGNLTAGAYNILIGWHAGIGQTPSWTGNDNICVGQATGAVLTTGSYNVMLGSAAGATTTTGSHNIFIGRGAGNNVSATADHIFVVGGATATPSYITDGYFGSDIVYAAPVSFTLHASGGLGANIAGATLGLAGGQSTGSAVGGSVVISTAPAGGAGSALNALLPRLTITGAGVQTHLGDAGGTVPTLNPGTFMVFQRNNTAASVAELAIIGGKTTGESNLVFGDDDAVDRGRIKYLHSADAMQFHAAATQTLYMTAGILFVTPLVASGGVTSNANMTRGLTISQGGSDDQIAAFKSSDVAHGVTGVAETDTFGYSDKLSATAGGLQWTGITETTIGGMYRGLGGTPVTTPSTTADAYVIVKGEKYSGTALTNSATNELVFGVRTRIGGADRNMLLVDADGDLFLDGAAGAAFDAWDDVALVRALDVARSPAQIIRTRWDDHVRYNRGDLVAAGILTTHGDDAMVNVSQHMRLLNGAAWQQHVRMSELHEEIASLRAELAALRSPN